MKILLVLGVIAGAYYLFKEDEDNVLIGGLGDELDEEDVDAEELEMGIKVEMEHTKDKNIAREIALDHLSSCPKYYSLLLEMEKKNECD